jgi:hypothetical protein
MSPKVRLPLAELADQAKAEVAAVMSKLRDENAEQMIAGWRDRGAAIVAGY